MWRAKRLSLNGALQRDIRNAGAYSPPSFSSSSRLSSSQPAQQRLVQRKRQQRRFPLSWLRTPILSATVLSRAWLGPAETLPDYRDWLPRSAENNSSF